MSERPICERCREREAEFEIRKISADPAKGFRRSVCKPCLGSELADDTTSIVRISKPDGDEAAPSPEG